MPLIARLTLRHHRGGHKAKGKRQKAKVGSVCSTPCGITEVGKRQKVKGKRQKAKGKRQKQEVGAQRLSASHGGAKGKSRKWVLIAFRLHSGGHLLPFAFCLLPFAFQGVASVRNPKSKIENPKSCVGPSAILTGSRRRPSDWGWNGRFGLEEDRRNNHKACHSYLCSSDLVAVTFHLALGFQPTFRTSSASN